MAVLDAELPVDLEPLLPCWRQVSEQAKPGQAVGGPFEHFGVFEVEALFSEWVEGLEQALFEREGQRHSQAKLAAVQTFELGRRQDLLGQALGTLIVQQAFLI
ncbi:hypothetical protein D3C80_1902740 [compost metagenome]